MPDKIKRCSACKSYKAVDDFYFRVDRPTVRRADCKACCAAARDRWRKNNPDKSRVQSRRYYHSDKERQRRYRLKSKYDLTADQFQNRLTSQNGVCAICKAAPKRRWVVDHDHATGEIRGLLCDDCNVGLGRFKDSCASLASAILYLDKTKA